MKDNLVIVESPAKAKTIEKILGSDFTVMSSYGHIRDLAKHGMAIDVEHGFEPHYEVSPDKVKLVSDLRKAAAQAKVVWLASDEDREGEAIAWHLEQALTLPAEKVRRIVFHEITASAIKHAVENPRQVDLSLVDAQQARRVLDRLVGFELSPLLWKKVKPSLSAGRVQSVAVRLVVEREREVLGFASTGYYRVVGEFTTPGGGKFKAELSKRVATLAEAEALMRDLASAEFRVSAKQTNPGKRTPAAPFTTSTLQQEASRKLGFSVSQTMSVAQKLYEQGYITYMRTDSVNLSGFALGAAKEAIVEAYGEQYYKYRTYSTKSKGAQEAHEAIRPTEMRRMSVEDVPANRRLYELIWKRTVASQMADAKLEKTVVAVLVSNRAETFVATGEIVIFDGFLKLYMESSDDDSEATGGPMDSLLPAMAVGDDLRRGMVTATEKFTQRPARYSEASLVKKLEELGIGRPSTYAPTISTVITRGYVVKEDRVGVSREFSVVTLAGAGSVKVERKSEVTGSEKSKLFPTDIGMVVTDFLQQHFADVLDYNFTASVEKEFDEIAEGNLAWREMLAAFYGPFHATVTAASENSEYARTERLLGVDPASGKNVYARVGRFGPMVQMGDSEEVAGVKPKFASLQKGQLVASITLEEALALFVLPRTLGEYEGHEVVVSLGRFGPFVRHDGKFTSLKTGDDPYDISLERAVELIEDKRLVDKNRVIHDYQDIQVLNGRWGPYIAFSGKNYKIPKTTDAATLSVEDCRELIVKGDQEGTASSPRKAAGAKGASKFGAKTTAKTATSKTAAVRKTTTVRKTAPKTKA